MILSILHWLLMRLIVSINLFYYISLHWCFCNVAGHPLVYKHLLVHSWHRSQRLLSPYPASEVLSGALMQYNFNQWNLYFFFKIFLKMFTNVYLSHVCTYKCIQHLYLNMWALDYLYSMIVNCWVTLSHFSSIRNTWCLIF